LLLGAGSPLPPPVVPATVSDLRASALTDTSVVLTWTEVSSGSTTIARYLVRYGLVTAPSLAGPYLVTGGCGAPVYGSLAGGGRIRACVLGGLTANTGYAFQVIAYTGTLSTTNNFGDWSNRATATTATRVGPILVWRPRLYLDSLTFAAVSVSDWGTLRFPAVRASVGDRQLSFYDSSGAVAGLGYLLVTKP
jgi:hypothetical protein